MKVKVKNGFQQYQLDANREYEVIAIQMTRSTKRTSCGTQYYLYRDNESIGPYDEFGFEITDPTLESDYVVKNADQYDALYILPDSISVEFFHDWMVSQDEICLTKEFYVRFRHLISDYKFAAFSREHYQDPEIEIVAEAIGDNWVLCPECKEAFEVDPEQGVVQCTGCYTKMNNPYAKIFPQSCLEGPEP